MKFLFKLKRKTSEKKVCVGVYTPTHTFFSGHFYPELSNYKIIFYSLEVNSGKH